MERLIRSKKSFLKNFDYRKIIENLKETFFQIIAILLAFVVGAIVLLATGYSSTAVYASMIKGAFGDVYGLGQTLSQATPIIFTSIAFLI